jgi:hypothetical protein
MDDHVDTGEGLPHRVGIAHVADPKLDVGSEISGPRAAAVHLRREIVERAYAVAAREQLVGEV